MSKLIFPKEIYYKNATTKIEDVGQKGEVKFWFSVNNVPDGYKQIGQKGMFQKSINERKDQILHHKNHDSTTMPGVLTDIQDLDYGGQAVSKLILSTKEGADTYEQYKAMAEAGKSMPHSYHFDFVKPTLEEALNAYMNDQELKLKEVALIEVSTLTQMACNPLAITQTIKSLNSLTVDDLLIEDTFYKLLLNSKFEDKTLENLQTIKNHIEALIKEKSRETTQHQNEPLFGLTFLTNKNEKQ